MKLSQKIEKYITLHWSLKFDHFIIHFLRLEAHSHFDYLKNIKSSSFSLVDLGCQDLLLNVIASAYIILSSNISDVIMDKLEIVFTRAAPAFDNLFMGCVFNINTVHKTVEKLTFQAFY